jgi:hypothetical protein
MNNIKVGDFVIVRSNNSVNREVGKSKEVYLTIGYRDKIEDGADFVCIIEPRPMKRFFKEKFNCKTCRFEKNVTIHFNGVRIMSTKTKKIYDVDADWCSGYAPNSKEYKDAVDFAIIDKIMEKRFLEDYDNAMPETWDY